MYNAMTAGRSQANQSSAHESAREAWIDTSLQFSELVTLLGRKAEAIASLREALSIAEELLQDQPESAPARRRLIVVCSALATLQDDDEPAQSTSGWRRACVLLEQICAASPASNSDRVLLADCCCMLAAARGPDRPPG